MKAKLAATLTPSFDIDMTPSLGLVYDGMCEGETTVVVTDWYGLFGTLDWLDVAEAIASDVVSELFSSGTVTPHPQGPMVGAELVKVVVTGGLEPSSEGMVMVSTHVVQTVQASGETGAGGEETGVLTEVVTGGGGGGRP
jgi:hypothetical protein